MSVELASGSLFDCGADALVNPVNCVGVAGRGLAAAFKARFPDNWLAYKRACGAGSLIIGRPLCYRRNGAAAPWMIVNFPTKYHWRNPSRLFFISASLPPMLEGLMAAGAQSVGIPALGCGLGGLAWKDVQPLLVAAFQGAPVRAMLFEPRGEEP